MGHEAVKAEMRLRALEVLVFDLLVTILANDAAPLDALKNKGEQMIRSTQMRTFSELSEAALSDLHSAELQSAVERLMEMAKTQMLLGLPPSRIS
jgi:hypothetical protein